MPAALTAAAERIDAPAVATRSEARANGVVVHGLGILDGTEINWEGANGLTTVRVTVPWGSDDGSSGKKLLAANRFAQVFASQASLAA